MYVKVTGKADHPLVSYAFNSLLQLAMDSNGDNDFDAAAFGLPTGFGAVSKQIPKKQKQAKADIAAFDSTRRSEAPSAPVADVRDLLLTTVQ
jgi:uncharacterized protein (DUF2141 family)